MNSVLLAVSKCPNPTVFQKTLGVNDFYFGTDEFPYPMGHISFVGKLDGVTLSAGAPAIDPVTLRVVGGAPSDSERDLSMGNVEHVVIDAFDGFDYVALGHLHGPQAFADGRVAYSGSPLPYSFSEERHNKSVSIVELGPDGAATVDRVRLDVGMNVRSITGRLDELVSDRSHTEAETAWVRATLTDPELPHQAMARLKRRFPRVVELRHRPEGRVLDVSAAGPRRDR